MKKTLSKVRETDDMRAEYDFSGGVRGKYAKQFGESSIAVVLEPDVARAFPSARAVNGALRELIRSKGRGPRKASRRVNSRGDG